MAVVGWFVSWREIHHRFQAVEKAQEAVARITSKVAAATTETQSMR
jgi:hypothetical protein